MRSRVPTRLRKATGCGGAIAAATALGLALATGHAARAQTADGSAIASNVLGARGGVAAKAPTRSKGSQDAADGAIEFSFLAGIASDYIYRGTTLSDRRPAAGASAEAAFGQFYAAATVTSVKLPSQPTAEITLGGGVRPKLGEVELDFGWTYFHYPGEVAISPTGGSEYWEAAARADTKIGDLLRVAGGFAYSPNVSNTGAWSKYAAFGLGIDLPRDTLPRDVTASLTGGAGYFWFGNQAAVLGGFPLPAYLNWNAGMTFTRGSFNLDLRYYDTNLSKEDCFVFTGDPNATAGGRVNSITNPQGLVSGWCSATLVAKLWIALN